MTLSIVKVSRYSDNCCSNGFAEEIFRGFLHFLQHFSRHLRSGHFLAFRFNPSITVVSLNNFVRHDFDIALNFFVFKTTTDQTLDCK
ncbi:NAD-specific glutamate dehydrogenase [Vibrio cholerae]|nr:NAD-specific glutamate dehydrogenase [Vibrio cholerae]